jgi:TIR domain
MLGHEVWVDEDITGGQAWWNLILEALRNADVVVAAVSERALDSQACVRERSYASALGKPILLVLIESVMPDLLPPELARLHFVEYGTPDAPAALRLAVAIAKVQPVPLPDVLPPSPSAPFSSLSELSQRVRAESLDRAYECGPPPGSA